ncbi:hypothetical protein [Myxococcus sp. NMCA1]|uniref:hypothetical protein n=1 Tax=Myxococcus sp. NMCA1 TaxID=2996785 RepID=UPI0022867DDB|nr:hypothetical protein [Myxococcus sp. NMCA1]WAM26336.1 hypothetical protein OZ403_38395 [Myxococcus sp. NMCA1]
MCRNERAASRQRPWPTDFAARATYGINQSQRFERYARVGPDGEEVGQAEGYLPYAFEQAHTFKAALSYRFPFVTVGAVAHFNTGRPESGQFGYRTMQPGTTEDGTPEWRPVSRDAVGRLPPFFRLDVRASHSWAFNNFVLDVYLDVFNVTARSEVISRKYGFEEASTGAIDKLRVSTIDVPVILPTLGAKGTF